ncbi:MAG: Holliday junction branch migration protein RuvA [Alphaproteobacteria bacterium]|nr:Holliday junction branch migration protein RuvA [Alphaproteobacteria bacterium]OJV14234.1 MAG: Holliday junction DNA helicase RuvA [Alphaproteobacteria bacterium 33-17]
MFASLKGIPEIIDDEVILDVGGVGYRVFCAVKTAEKLDGNPVKLYIETIVREDQISLYGFLNRTDLSWFRMLITVKGVGPKVALNILSHVDFEGFAKDVMLGNKTSLAKINGIGPRTAERIIVELKDKIATITPTSYVEMVNNIKPAHEDAIAALVTLGYSKYDASKVVANVVKANDNADTKELIRLSLRELSK